MDVILTAAPSQSMPVGSTQSHALQQDAASMADPQRPVHDLHYSSPAVDAPDVESRVDRIERIKRAIEAGTYETEEILDATINRLMQHIDLK